MVTGAWGEKAFSEAKAATAMLGGSAKVAFTTGTGDGKEKSYVRAPAAGEVKARRRRRLPPRHLQRDHPRRADRRRRRPRPTRPPAACRSSPTCRRDFLWKPIDVSKFGLIYAGAQKNIGPSGVVVMVISKALIEQGRKDIPKIFQFRTPAENKSLYNTPPTFGIYMIRNVLAWLKGLGGLPAMEARNRKKAAVLYGAIDGNPGYFRCPVEKQSRSVMNIVFRLPTEADEERFVKEAKAKGMVGLKGHRSVGGIRASTYNAVEPAWIDELAGLHGRLRQEGVAARRRG